MDQRIIETVRRLQPALEQLGIHPQAVVLFGSHATGEARPESDIHVAVLSDDFQGVNMLRGLELVATALARAKIAEPIAALASEEARQELSLGKDACDWKVELAQEDLRRTGPSREGIVTALKKTLEIQSRLDELYPEMERNIISFPSES